MAPVLTRRRFALAAAATLAASQLPAQAPLQATDTTRANLAVTERDHILADATLALKAQPKSTRAVSANVAALTAGFIVTKEERFAFAARDILNDWLPAPISKSANPPNVLDLVPIAELARATSFLSDAVYLTQIDAWLLDLLTWLTTARDPVIVRDTKDHRASAWLLIASAVARSQRNNDPLGDKVFDHCRVLFRKPTLRNQIDEVGRFPQELATANPFRNTLFNFDLLFGACQLLDAPLEPLWTFELIDGVSLRSVVAYLFPFLQDRNRWPGVSDAEHFRELPGRRPGLLFAGRAFHRPEYVELWRATPPAIPPDLADSFPIRQPVLWTTRAAHGL
jgi:hypothetical protein